MPASTLLHTADDFDALPDGSLVLTIEIVFPNSVHGRRRTLWQKFGKEWVQLDPSDRQNGEESKPSGYLENLLTGFGNKRTVPGVGLLLGEGENVNPDLDTELPVGSVVKLDGEPFPFTYAGSGKWDYMDPADPYDGEYPTTTANLISGETVIHVLYRPGDEEHAGFTPVFRAEAPAPKTPELNVDAMSDCAQAYVAEYGSLPANRAEQDRYSAFRFGFEHGQKNGSAAAYRDIAKYASERA